jgi:hypothetical protein
MPLIERKMVSIIITYSVLSRAHTISGEKELFQFLALPALNERIDAKIFTAINFMQTIAKSWYASGFVNLHNRTVLLLSALIRIENTLPNAYYVSLTY